MTIASFTGLAHFHPSIFLDNNTRKQMSGIVRSIHCANDVRWMRSGSEGGGAHSRFCRFWISPSSSRLISSAQRLVETPDATDNSAWPVFRLICGWASKKPDRPGNEVSMITLFLFQLSHYSNYKFTLTKQFLTVTHHWITFFLGEGLWKM